MARELSRPLKLFVASQPTRGVDVGSIEFLHQRIVAERDHGTPVIIVSTELDEVLELADRIAVMYRGRIVGIVPGGTDARRARPDDGRRPAGRGREAGQRPPDHPRAGRPRRRHPGRLHRRSEGALVTAPPLEKGAPPPASTPSTPQAPRRAGVLQEILASSTLVVVLAVLLALLVAALLVASADEDVQRSAGYSNTVPNQGAANGGRIAPART